MTVVNGAYYQTHPYLSFGDYSDTGLVGKSNVLYLCEEIGEEIEHGDLFMDTLTIQDKAIQPKAIIVFGFYASQTLFLRSDVFDDLEIEKKLDRYSLLCEDHHSHLQAETFDQAWNDYLFADYVTDMIADLQRDLCSDRLQVSALHYMKEFLQEQAEFKSLVEYHLSLDNYGWQIEGMTPCIPHADRIYRDAFNDFGGCELFGMFHAVCSLDVLFDRLDLETWKATKDAKKDYEQALFA